MHSTPTLRRTAVLATALVALGAPILSSCGFDAATDRPNVIAAGVNDRQGQVQVLGAVIVGTGPGTGVFEATLNNTTTLASATATTTTTPSVDPSAGRTAGVAPPAPLPPGADQLLSVTGGSDGDLRATRALTPYVIGPSAAINLTADDLGIPVTGSWTNPGPFVTITLTFASGQVSTLSVPVVKPCFTYAGVIATPTPTDGATDNGVGGSDADTDPFSCDAETRPDSSTTASDGSSQ